MLLTGRKQMKEKNAELEIRNKHVGTFLKVAREKAGLTQYEIAQRLHYSTPQFVSNWERGISLPPLDVLPRLTEVLHLSPKQLIESLSRYQDEILKLRKRELQDIFKRHRREA